MVTGDHDSPRRSDDVDAAHIRWHFAEPFLRTGWVVASATAQGNSFGNDASLADYRALIGAALTRYGALRILFASESMGPSPRCGC